jgi:hypothetical protein
MGSRNSSRRGPLDQTRLRRPSPLGPGASGLLLLDAGCLMLCVCIGIGGIYPKAKEMLISRTSHPRLRRTMLMRKMLRTMLNRVPSMLRHSLGMPMLATFIQFAGFSLVRCCFYSFMYLFVGRRNGGMSAVAQITFAILSHSRRNEGKMATDCLDDIKVTYPPTHTHTLTHSHKFSVVGTSVVGTGYW